MWVPWSSSHSGKYTPSCLRVGAGSLLPMASSDLDSEMAKLLALKSATVEDRQAAIAQDACRRSSHVIPQARDRRKCNNLRKCASSAIVLQSCSTILCKQEYLLQQLCCVTCLSSFLEWQVSSIQIHVHTIAIAAIAQGDPNFAKSLSTTQRLPGSTRSRRKPFVPCL